MNRTLRGAGLVALAGALALASCSDDSGPGTDPPPTTEQDWTQCQASDQAFVRRALNEVVGRRPRSQAEVDALVDVLVSTRESLEDEDAAKRVVVAAMLRDPAFGERWADFFMDQLGALRVAAVRDNTYKQVQTTQCYGSASDPPTDNGSLAAWVRDNSPAATGGPFPSFDLGQLLKSCLELDDVSPLYRAHLFHMLAFPIAGANVEGLELEKARRDDFGNRFEQSYIHRDPGCLPCHNSVFSVTADYEDPAKSRAWPLPGNFEAALYGSPSGGSLERSRAMFRVVGVADGGGVAPWGWNGDRCATFKVPTEKDPLNVDAAFGSVGATPDDPDRGLRASVWQLETALRNGFDRIAADGLVIGENGAVHPDDALAYLVAAHIVEQVFYEVVGSRLTIANFFPRTEGQRDTLQALTDGFVASRFSIRTLLLDIATHPLFNLSAPSDGCGQEPYEIPRILDPWTDSEADPAQQGNGAGDRVHAMSTRVLLRGMYRSLEWPYFHDFPDDKKDEEFYSSIGLFQQPSDPGIRGLDFQARLSWENAFGACQQQGNDYIARLAGLARSTSGATIEDAVIALKDRLLGEPFVTPGEERAEVEALVGQPLSSPVGGDLDSQLRRLCGVYVSSPQFMLSGIAQADGDQQPKLLLPEQSYATACTDIARQFLVIEAPVNVDCGGERASVSVP